MRTLEEQETFVDDLGYLEDIIYDILSDLPMHDPLTKAWSIIFSRLENENKILDNMRAKKLKHC